MKKWNSDGACCGSRGQPVCQVCYEHLKFKAEMMELERAGTEENPRPPFRESQALLLL